jgi:hypothetical protein
MAIPKTISNGWFCAVCAVVGLALLGLALWG